MQYLYSGLKSEDTNALEAAPPPSITGAFLNLTARTSGVTCTCWNERQIDGRGAILLGRALLVVDGGELVTTVATESVVDRRSRRLEARSAGAVALRPAHPAFH